MWLDSIESSNQLTTHAITMTPTKLRYPGDKGFLTVPIDDKAHRTTQLDWCKSDSTDNNVTQELVFSVHLTRLLRQVLIEEVSA